MTQALQQTSAPVMGYTAIRVENHAARQALIEHLQHANVDHDVPPVKPPGQAYPIVWVQNPRKRSGSAA